MNSTYRPVYKWGDYPSASGGVREHSLNNGEEVKTFKGFAEIQSAKDLFEKMNYDFERMKKIQRINMRLAISF